MNRCLLLCISFLAACQVTETARVDQAISTGDYCGAEMPAAPSWVPGEQAPQVDQKERIVVWEHKPGEWLAVLASPETGEITWARTVANKDLGPFISSIDLTGHIDISRPPPPPPPPDGTKYLSAVVLESARLANEVPDVALGNVTAACPMPKGY
jgi:hypothetical protein